MQRLAQCWLIGIPISDSAHAETLAAVTKRYPVRVEDTRMGGVRVGIISPKEDVAPRNRGRVLVNAHGSDIPRRGGPVATQSYGGTKYRLIHCNHMLDHTGFVVSDLKRARHFYDAVAKALGLGTMDNGKEAFLLGRSADEPIPYLWIGTSRPSYWAEGSRPGLNQMHVAFAAPNKAVVDEFYRAALQAGGRDNGKPGLRPRDVYCAFVLDPDGNNIETCVHGPFEK